MMENNKIVKYDEQGCRSDVANYDGKFSAEYALYLYWCQYIQRTDYMNLANRRKYNGLRSINKSGMTVSIEAGTDVYICNGTKDHNRSAIIGDSGSKFDYEPNYPQR